MQVRHLLGILKLLLWGAAAAAEDARVKTLPAIFTESPPVLDGVLDPAFWREAAVVDDLHMVVPDEFAPPSERSVIYVLYGREALYFAARFYDDPDKITARVLRQGDASWGEDGFSVILDPFNQGRSGYIFDINPNGVRSQAIYTNATEQNWAWRGIWHGAARRDGEGWTAEVAIPYKTLSFDPANEVWGINFTRWLGRRNERFGWVSHNREQHPAASGRLVGITGIDQGAGLDVVPGFRAGGSRDRVTGRRDTFAEPSLDVFYKLTPALTAALTLNTDFAGTTADTRQLNLTRFDLFFPEQRKFFLQDADIFDFGHIGDDSAQPFFSRRIGLGPAGEPVDIEAGGKLTGRLGRFDIGFIDIEQAAASGSGSTNLFVGRVAANVLAESSAGAIVTHGDPLSGESNTLVGFDFRYLNTRASENRTIHGAAWYQRTDTDGMEGRDAAFGFSVDLPSRDGWVMEAGFKEVQANYNPALGFVNRHGVREYELDLGYVWRPQVEWLRTVTTRAEMWRVDRIGGALESRELKLTLLELENQEADWLTLDYLVRREQLFSAFEISEGVVIPPGDYAFDRYCATVTTGTHRALSGELYGCGGQFYNGKRRDAGADLTWRPSRHLRLGAGLTWNAVELLAGDFIARLASLRADFAFTATWYWENFLQYDNVSESIGVNSIVRWIPQAGRETVLVLNRQLEDFDRDNRFASLYTELTLKLAYTFRF